MSEQQAIEPKENDQEQVKQDQPAQQQHDEDGEIKFRDPKGSDQEEEKAAKLGEEGDNPKIDQAAHE